MTSNQKSSFYLDLIKKSHEAFHEYLVHLPEDILDWKVTDLMYSSEWIIKHIIHDQIWIVNVILNNDKEGYHFEDKSDGLILEELIEEYDKMVIMAEDNLSKLDDSQLEEMRNYKDYTISVEDWLYEYIFHLNQHSGELGFILTAWKRKNRSLSED